MADEEQTAEKSPWYKRTWVKVLGYSFVFLWGFAVGDTESGSPEERLERAKRDLESATVQRLLEAGADPNRQDPAGTTALMTAAISGQSEVVQHLVAAGALLVDGAAGAGPGGTQELSRDVGGHDPDPAGGGQPAEEA